MAKKTIKAPNSVFSGHVAGVRFEDGVGHTDDENAIAYFERQGYGVSGEAAKQPGTKDAKYPLGDPSDKWKKAELLARL